jgi:hypothetical protein
MSGVPTAIQSSFAPESFTSFAYFVGTDVRRRVARAPSVLECGASVAGPSTGTVRAPAAGLGPTSMGGVVVVEPDRVTTDSRRHRSLSPA